MNLSKKDLVMLQIIEAYEEKSNVEFCTIIKQKIGILLELMETLVEDEIQVEDGQGWSESLIQKLCLHAVTLMELEKGVKLPYGKEQKELLVADKPSIRLLLRAVIECYLTFNYLFIENVPDKEKRFRIKVWQYSGINQRIHFDMNSEEGKLRQKNERPEWERLRNEIIKSDCFELYKSAEKEKILKGLKPRLFNSWSNLILRSGLRKSLFNRTYSFHSNYSHSEFLSIQQIKAGILKYDSNEKQKYELQLLHYLVVRCIFDIQILFPSLVEHYNKIDEDIRTEMQMVNMIATEKPDYSKW